jgi:nitroreductase
VKGGFILDFQEILRKRYSVRSFESTPPENDKIDAILEAARIAPTAGNKQPQRIVVARTAEELEKIDLCTPCRYNAQVVFVICYDKTECWTSPFNTDNSGHVDTSIVTTYMMLEAENAGLGTVWVLRFDPAKATEQFHLPGHIIPVSMLAVGYPAKDAAPSERHDQRFPKEHMLFP